MNRSTGMLALPIAALATVVVALPGCHEGGGGDDPEPNGACVRDAELLAAQWDCIEDEDCPCGAHCVLGQCVSDCMQNADCSSDLVCDILGRCSDGELIREPSTAAQPQIEVDVSRLVFTAADMERSIGVKIGTDGIGPMRVMARAGLLVRCDEAEEFTAECMIEVLPDAGENVEIRVKSDDEPTDDEDRGSQVDIWVGDDRYSVPATIDDEEAAPLEHPEGVYVGFIQPIEAGSAARSSVETLPELVSNLTIPVTITVFPGEWGVHTVEIMDDLGAVFSEDGVVGQLVYDTTDGWSLDIPAWQVLYAESSNATSEIWVDTISAPANWEGESMGLTFRTSFMGATMPGHAPFLGWNLAAVHTAELPVTAVEPAVPSAYTPLLSPDRATLAMPIEDDVAAQLSSVLGGMAGTDAEYVSMLMCTDRDATSPTYLSDGVLELAGTPSPTGDLACEGGAGMATFALMNTNLLTVNENIATCLTDLEKVDLALAGDPTQVLMSDGCVDASRVIAALGYGLQSDRERAMETGTDTDADASALSHRLLQQWLATHTFMGQEALKIQSLNDILDPASAVDQDFTLADAVGTGIAGWDLLLHPRIAVPLPLIPAEVLSSPDYRERLFPAETYPTGQTNDQGVGLPAAMLDAGQSQLMILATLIEAVRNHQADEAEVLGMVGDLVPRVIVAFALAHTIHDSALTLGAPPWEDQWERARVGSAAGIAAILTNMQMLREGGNPLGIEDGDLPLYQVGDESTANQRFSALTDFLLGTTDDGVAQYMVNRADGALEGARTAWLANVDRDLEAQLETFERERRVTEIRNMYGEEVGSLCGNLPYTTYEILDHWTEIDGNTCYISDTCAMTPTEQVARLGTAEFGYQLCVLHKVRQRVGPGMTTGNIAMDVMLDSMTSLFPSSSEPFPFRITDIAGTQVEASQGGSVVVDIDVPAVMNVEFDLGPDVDHKHVEEAFSWCDAARQQTLNLRPSEPPASCTLTDQCPEGWVCGGGSCSVDTSAGMSDNPECYTGAIGSQAISLRSAAKEVAMARQEVVDTSDRFEIAMRSCQIMAESNRREETLTIVTNAIITTLSVLKLVADIGSSVTGNAMDACGLDTAVTGGGKAAFAIVKSVFDTASLVLDALITEIERYADMAKEFMQNWEEETICLNDATMELVGLESASMRVEQALLDLSKESLEYNDLKGSVGDLLEEGHTMLMNEEARQATPITTDFWLSGDVTTYRKHMRQAKRVTYLAVLAAEYEYQFSSIERLNVLAAMTPGDLQGVVDSLRAFTMTGTVAGASPSDKLYVVSLRDSLLQLQDHSIYPDGWLTLSDEERFRMMLTSSHYAVHDSEGTYIGQEIPFTIAPLGTMELGDAQGIPLLAGMDCAERLWSVNASLLGEQLYSGSDTTFAEITLKKRNTFFSQWCTSGHDELFDLASTRPARNLFLDPLDVIGSSTSATPTPNVGATDETAAFTKARISAYFNIARADMEDESYFNGDSQELAARGLYGDYALYFPAEILSIDGSQGLNIMNITDILLRLDYVSVASSRD